MIIYMNTNNHNLSNNRPTLPNDPDPNLLDRTQRWGAPSTGHQHYLTPNQYTTHTQHNIQHTGTQGHRQTDRQHTVQ